MAQFICFEIGLAIVYFFHPLGESRFIPFWFAITMGYLLKCFLDAMNRENRKRGING